MARVRRYCFPALIAVLALAFALPAGAEESAAPPPTGLHDRPVLVLDPGMHTAMIKPADVDAAGRHAVTGSDDKTVRVWSVADGRLERTIRVPAGPGEVGMIYAVAISPDGELIAAGGFTAQSGAVQQIYLFDRNTGSLIQRIEGLPNVVLYLTFSPDGHRLVATLAGANGVRAYAREAGWAEVARDTDYEDSSYGVDFSTDGRLATTSRDGRVRLYDDALHPIAKVKAPGGQTPFGIAFSPDGTRLAVGYSDTTVVDLVDGHTLATLPGPDAAGIDNGNLSKVAWSADGKTLFAGVPTVVATKSSRSGRGLMAEAGPGASGRPAPTRSCPSCGWPTVACWSRPRTPTWLSRSRGPRALDPFRANSRLPRSA